ncbi:hypothetical protein BC358_07355 [Hydrogenophaga sp. H7]|nr:hypothetical protein BC358_07355 [Hydrogenophaga sp. H7]
MGTVVALSKDAGTRLQVRADFERLFVGLEAVFRQVVAIDLRDAYGKVVALFLELTHSGQRFFKTFGLARQVTAHHSDGERIAR